MATLKAMFKLFDGYSSTVNKIIAGTDKAAASVGKASKGTDSYNQSLKNTGASASAASSGLKKLIGVVVSLAAAQKAMDLTDTYTNTNARLSMITNSLEEQKALQAEVYAAADRSRGSYVEMANATAKMKMLAGEAFGSNEEALGFTELLQKSLKVSGAGTSEQQSAFLQLTQAMSAGKLQGDEFRSVMENAPMVANAIAEYMGKSKGELKEMSSKGLITADIIKNAMFDAADDINAKFNTMPMTFADVWQKIKNAGMEAFGGVFEKANAMLNSANGQQLTNGLVGGLYLAADAANVLLDDLSGAYSFIQDNWSTIGPILAGVATVFLLLSTYQAISAAKQWLLNSALYACPFTWIFIGIGLLVAALYAGVAAVNHFKGTSISATGIIGAAFGFLAAKLFNTFIFPIWNMLSMLGNFIGNACFNDPVSAVKILFLDMATTCVDYVLNMAKAIENIINSIPGVKVDITSGLEGFKSGLEDKIGEIKDESGWKEYIKQPELMDISDMTAAGYSKGAGLEDKVSNLFSGFAPGDTGNDFDFSQFASAGSPATVKGTGKGGAVKVENEEDIEWMRKLAERDYVARIAQNTLAPNIKVEFSGPITKEADTDGIMGRVVEQLKDVIATAPEGVPA